MGFSYNDIHSKDMRLKARLTSWQVCGALRNSTAIVPGKYGVSDFGADFDSREIKVSCGIYPQKTFSTLIATLDDIALWLDPTNGLKQLILDDAPDRYFMARLNDKVDCERLLISAAGSFDLKFFCPDPFGYAVDDENFIINTTGASSINREKGNIISNPVYRLSGVITASPRNYISITTNNAQLKIVNATLTTNETLVVDSENLTAWIEDVNGSRVRNALPYLQDLNFPSLAVGDNTVDVTASGAVFTKLEIQAKSRWR